MNLYELLFNRGQSSGEGMTNFERLFAAKLAGGEIKELEGVPPLTFTSRGLPLINYLIEGNAVQDGTPSADAPVDATGCGVRTGNLFDENYPNISGTIRYIPLYVGEGSFTLSTTTPYDSSVANVFLLSGNVSTGASTPGNGAWLYHNVTTQSVDGYVTIAYRHYSGTTSPANCQTMLNLGSTALPYEPYGYKLPLTVNGVEYPIYLGQVETTRRIKKLVLTGDDGEWNRSSIRTGSFYLRLGNVAIPGFGLCDRAINVRNVDTYSSPGQMLVERSGTSILINVWLFDTNLSVDDFKSYLAAQYAAGTPVTIWYVLAKPETAVVNEPLMKIGDYADTVSFAQAGVTIPTVIGENVLDVPTEVKPSDVWIRGRIKEV